jgi:uncharacterized repeat protein (TIGR03803 family)
MNNFKKVPILLILIAVGSLEWRAHAQGLQQILWSLAAGDGGAPQSVLVQSAGNLFGTTAYGGTNGSGTVFRIGTNGTGFSVLYYFTNGTDGGHPVVGVIQGADGGL